MNGNLSARRLFMMRLMYSANIVVAGYVGLSSLFAPFFAEKYVFASTKEMIAGPTMQLVGCLWTAIAVLSAVGLVFPALMFPVFLLQEIYKSLWLVVVVLPKLLRGKGDEIPVGMSAFFLVWVLVLPFIIPWAQFSE
jgi:hypothetical protein